MRDREGNIILVILTMYDIIGQKESERPLKELTGSPSGSGFTFSAGPCSQPEPLQGRPWPERLTAKTASLPCESPGPQA